MKKEPTFNDFNSASPSELKKHYKLSDKGLETAFRSTALEGANQQQMKREYEKFYRKNRRDA